MRPVLYPPPRPQAIGEVLDSAFRIFKATLLKSLPYSVLATVAGQLQRIYVMVSGRDLRPFGSSYPGYGAGYVLGAIVGGVLICAIMIRQAALAAGTASTTLTALMQ